MGRGCGRDRVGETETLAHCAGRQLLRVQSDTMGPFFSLLLAKDAFLSTCATYYGQEYADAIDRLTPDWIIAVFVALALLGGILGGMFGKKLLKKHFSKVGAV